MDQVTWYLVQVSHVDYGPGDLIHTSSRPLIRVRSHTCVLVCEKGSCNKKHMVVLWTQGPRYRPVVRDLLCQTEVPHHGGEEPAVAAHQTVLPGETRDTGGGGQAQTFRAVKVLAHLHQG